MHFFILVVFGFWFFLREIGQAFVLMSLTISIRKLYAEDIVTISGI